MSTFVGNLFANSQLVPQVDNLLNIQSTSYGFDVVNTGLFDRKKQPMYFTNLSSVNVQSSDINPLTSIKGIAQKIFQIPDVECYIDPQNIKISRKVISNKKLTKGGWLTTFWGHDLTEISVSMVSGYYGMTKGRILAGATEAIASNGTNTSTVDPLKIFQKIKDSVYNSRFDENVPFAAAPFITLVYEGKPYDGFFTSFDYSISSQTPFFIDFSFDFTVLPVSSKDIFSNAISLASNLAGVGNSSPAWIGKISGVVTNPNGSTRNLYSGINNILAQSAQNTANYLTGLIGLSNAIDVSPSSEDLK